MQSPDPGILVTLALAATVAWAAYWLRNRRLEALLASGVTTGMLIMDAFAVVSRGINPLGIIPTVTPSTTPMPSPTATQLPATIQITKPSGPVVGREIEVSGTSSGLPSETEIWVFTGQPLKGETTLR
jgi:hypothetical protein